ncbi:MAG: aminotransferase class I/II-fold pyridoxal phosphate-dependent enzyme [Bacteroidales bacterium]|nr:aminotransferase class I/II-fold pyridoxal phosphate-dependent enzyme [Bacteroidales bacterium]
MRKQGISVINLGIGSPDQPPASNVTEVLSSASSRHENHGYQSYTGIPALRKAFADWYLEHFGVELNPDSEILPLMGSKEGIMHISMAFVNEGDEVLIPNPGYPAYESVTRMIGGKVRFYDLVEEKGWLPDLRALEAEGLEKVKLMWVNYPHMPSGTKASIEFFRKLVEFGRKNHILICNDNPYSFILNEDTLSLLSLEGSSDVCLELNSLSKSHNMAGWRIGMVAGNSVYIKSVLKMKSNMDSGMFRPLQEAAVEALKSGREWYEKLNETYRRRRELAEQLMEALDCSFDSRQSGLFLWGRIPESYDHSEEFTDQILDSTHVFITPGFIFGSNGSRFIRISLCSDEATLKESIRRVDERFTAKNLHQTT